MEKKVLPLLKYEMAEDQVRFLLEVLSQANTIGEKGAIMLLRTSATLKNPLNIEEIKAVEAENEALEKQEKSAKEAEKVKK